MELIAKTLYGLEEILAKELRDLGINGVETLNRAVKFEGTMEDLYKVNYRCRTAISVLRPIHTFQIGTAKDIYRRSLKIKWDEYMDLDQTFAIKTAVNSALFNHTAYPGLILKDAIADSFRKKSELRPNVDTVNPDILFNLHIRDNSVTISIDSSGDPLYKRGYRINQGFAPINEVLAAGIILKTGWNPEIRLLDPMCGSGTIPIEAVLIANKIPPGKFRKSYGFMNWKDYDSAIFKKVEKEALSDIVDSGISIACSDISNEAVSSATINMNSAGVLSSIKLYTRDFFESGSGDQEFMIITNPPYGERIKEEDINGFYSDIGERLKHGYEGSTAWIITSNFGALKHVGLKPSEKHILFNGSLECRLVKYNLYKGSKKVKRSEDATIL
jgi:putative N6-adenine-specific DNA methylase